MACMHDPRPGQKGHIDANGVVKRRQSKTGRETIWSGGYRGRAADKQYSIVVTLDQAAFGDDIEYVCGVGALMRGDVVAYRGRKGLRAAELDISASCIAEVVFTLCLFPATVAVVQQSVREGGSYSLDIKIRYCRMQGRRRRRGVRLKVGRGRRRAGRGKTTRRGRGTQAGRSRRWRRAERRRRRCGGRDVPTVGGRAIIRTRWGIVIQDRGLASCASCARAPWSAESPTEGRERSASS